MVTADEETTRHIFGNAQAVFMRNWPYALNIFEKEGSPVKGKVGISPLPRFPGQESSSTLGGWNLGINRYSKHPRQAYALIRHLTSPEVQKQVFQRIGYLPTRSSLYSDPEILREKPQMGRLYQILKRARPRPVTPFYPGISQIMQAEVAAVWRGWRACARRGSAPCSSAGEGRGCRARSLNAPSPRK